MRLFKKTVISLILIITLNCNVWGMKDSRSWATPNFIAYQFNDNLGFVMIEHFPDDFDMVSDFYNKMQLTYTETIDDTVYYNNIGGGLGLNASYENTIPDCYEASPIGILFALDEAYEDSVLAVVSLAWGKTMSYFFEDVNSEDLAVRIFETWKEQTSDTYITVDTFESRGASFGFTSSESATLVLLHSDGYYYLALLK